MHKFSDQWIVFGCGLLAIAFASYFLISLFGIVSFFDELSWFYYVTAALLLFSSASMVCGAVLAKKAGLRWRLKLSLLSFLVLILICSHYFYYRYEVNFLAFVPFLLLLSVSANFFYKGTVGECCCASKHERGCEGLAIIRESGQGSYGGLAK